MKKFFKRLSIAVCLLLSAMVMLTFAACGSDDDGGKDGKKTYTFETEYTAVAGLTGGGISGGGAGLNMIQINDKASNGFYVGTTHRKDLTFTFEITSDKQTSAELTLRLANELAAMKLNPETFIIKVGGNALDYKEISLPGKPARGLNFEDYKVSVPVELAAGKNVITFTIGENEYCNGASGGPMFDCIKLRSDAALTWEPITGNLDGFSEE